MGSSPNMTCSLLCFSLLRERIVQLIENAKIGELRGAEGLTSLAEKTQKAHHLLMSMQRQPFLLNYFKTSSGGPTMQGLNPACLLNTSQRSFKSRGCSPVIPISSKVRLATTSHSNCPMMVLW